MARPSEIFPIHCLFCNMAPAGRCEGFTICLGVMEGLTVAFLCLGEAGLWSFGWLGPAPWASCGPLMLEMVHSVIYIWSPHTLQPLYSHQGGSSGTLCTSEILYGSMGNVCFPICSISGTFIHAFSHHHCHDEQSIQPKAFPGAHSIHQPWCFQDSFLPIFVFL